MTSPGSPGGLDDGPPPSGPETAAVVRLLRRRRRWTVAACCTVPVFAILLIATVIASVQTLRDGDPFPPAWQLAAFLAAPGAVAFVTVFAAVADSIRLGRVPGAAQARGRTVMNWRPARVRARRDRAGTWLVRSLFWIFILAYQAFLVVLAPVVTDGAAYLAGAGPSVTFVPQSYQQVCTARGGCHTVTLGRYEGTSTPPGTNWPDRVPLGEPFSVREPVWSWGTGNELVHGERGALERVGVGVLLLAFEGALVFLVLLAFGPLGRWTGGGRHVAH